MIKWTGLAPWELEYPFPYSLASAFLVQVEDVMDYLARFDEAWTLTPETRTLGPQPSTLNPQRGKASQLEYELNTSPMSLEYEPEPLSNIPSCESGGRRDGLPGAVRRGGFEQHPRPRRHWPQLRPHRGPGLPPNTDVSQIVILLLPTTN